MFAHAHSGAGGGTRTGVVAAAQHGLEFTELRRLESAARGQAVAEGVVLQRGHGFQDVQLRHAHLEDGANAAQGCQRAEGVAGLERALHGLHFVQNLLKPQFVHLVNGDEQRFVVFVGLGVVEVQKLVDLQVLGIGQCGAGHV